jgi:hypothetical protein
MRDIVCHMNGTADWQVLQRFLVRNRCQGPDLRFTGDLEAVGGTSHRFAFPPKTWLVHTLFQWVPPEQHFETHPEWFSLAGNERVAVRQLCFSNPDLRRELTRAILQGVGETDPGGVYSVSAMDWDGALCDCPDCQALVAREGTPGAPLFDYLAELGPQLKARFPEAAVSTLAYRKVQSEPPPRTIRLPDNVIVIFAPINDNFAAPIAHPSNADTLRNLQAWPRATSHLWVWYYPNPYGPPLPLGNLRRLASDFRLFRRLGVEGCYVEQDAPGMYDSQRVADLQTWLITKLMWDPDRNLDQLITDYTDRHYGAAAPLVRQYLAVLESANARQQTSMNWSASLSQHRFLRPDLLLQCQRLLDQAEAVVATDPAALPHVRHLRMSLDLACIMLWTQLTSITTEVPFTLQQITDRYRETYAEAARSRLLEKQWSPLLAAVDDLLEWYRLMTPLKPLPPPLDNVPPERVRQFTAESASLWDKKATRVQDSRAAAGIAVTMEPQLTPPGNAPADLPPNVLSMGFYDGVTGREQHAYAGREAPLTPGDYRLHSIGRTALNPASFVWFDWSWHITFPDVCSLFDPADANKQWDIYASVRFEGPAYDPESKADTNRFLVDRVVLVEAMP